MQGSKDLCLLNFAVFFYWDYIPTVWLLLVMTGSNGNTVGDNVVKVGGLVDRAICISRFGFFFFSSFSGH